MDPAESAEKTRITGSIQALIFLETIPYFITIAITRKLISLVLTHGRLEWDEIFKWKSICFALFSFLLLSLANYGDRISNGRFYIFLVFLFLSFIWTPLIIGAPSIDTILVFSSCLQPLLIVREASRFCFLVQPLLVGRHVTGIRFFFFLLFLFANLGAFFFVIGLKNLSETHLMVTSLVLEPVYVLLAAAAFKFGGNVVAHRNIVERGFKCLVLRFEQFLKRLFSPISKCLRKRKTEDYRKRYDPEIVTCTQCMLRLSITLAPFIIFFATVEMSFYTWVRDYDVMHDLGYAQWEITLIDIYHSFNIITALLIYLIILPLVESSVDVHDGVLLSIAYFILLLSWVSTSSLQYANELQQMPYPKENQAELVVFSNIETPTLIDSPWTEKQWLTSGDVVINKVKLSGLEAIHSNAMWKNASLYQNLTLVDTEELPDTSAISGFTGGTTSGPVKIGDIPWKSVANSTVCYLLTTTNDSSLSLHRYDETINRHFLEQTKSKPKLFGHLFTLCSRTLFYGPPYYLIIQHLRTRVMRTEQICEHDYTSITNLTVGWYTLFLRRNESYVPFEMLIEIQKEALHYLYIEKGSSNLTDYKGKIVDLVTPFFLVDKHYYLITLALFALAFTLGMVSLHAFVLRASPRHLHEFAFAIMYTTWSVGAGIAGFGFRYFCAHSRGMFFWVFFIVLGLLLFIRNIVIFIKHPHPCSPDGWVLEDALRAQENEALESESVDGDEVKAPTDSSLTTVEPTDRKTDQPEEKTSENASKPRKTFWQHRGQPKPKSSKKRKNDNSRDTESPHPVEEESSPSTEEPSKPASEDKPKNPAAESSPDSQPRKSIMPSTEPPDPQNRKSKKGKMFSKNKRAS